MIIESVVFFDLVIAILILSVTLVIIVISYTKTVHKLQALHKEKSSLGQEAIKKSDHILEVATEKGLKIVADANLFDDSRKKQFDQELKRVSEAQVKTLEKLSYDFLNIYQKELEALRENNINRISNLSKDIESTTIAELQDFKEILKKETFSSQKIVQDKIEEAYKVAQKELEIYKAERLKIVEDKIYEIIKNVSTFVLAKSINLDGHEQLVMDALSKAKVEGII